MSASEKKKKDNRPPGSSVSEPTASPEPLERNMPEAPPAEDSASNSPAPEEMPSQEELEQFFAECVTAAKERDEWKDRYARLAAEYENYRKRTAREKDQLYGDAQSETIAKFLPMYDNLSRAVASPSTDEAYKQGVELILKGLLDSLERMGVTLVPSLGQPFDPVLHEAVLHIEDESLPENSVAEVFLEGFVMGDRVVRHATVKVAN